MIRKSLSKTLVILFIALFLIPMLNIPLPVKAAETSSYISQWGSYGTGNGQFYNPLSAAIDSSNNVYIVDHYNNRIQKFTNDGNYIGQWGSSGSGNGQFSHPIDAAIDSLGYVYVTDWLNNRIQKFDSNGNFILSWGSSGSGDGQFNGVAGIEIDSAGYVYVTEMYNGRVQKFMNNSIFVTKWGSFGSGDGQLREPKGIVADNAGYIYVADTWNNRILKYTNSGILVTQWGSSGSGDGQFVYPGGLAIDATGSIYVVDSSNSRVQKFTSTGVFLEKWGSQGSGDGQFDGPFGIAIDSSGNFFIVDQGNSRVQKLFATQVLLDEDFEARAINSFPTDIFFGYTSSWPVQEENGNKFIRSDSTPDLDFDIRTIQTFSGDAIIEFDERLASEIGIIVDLTNLWPGYLKMYTHAGRVGGSAIWTNDGVSYVNNDGETSTPFIDEPGVWYHVKMILSGNLGKLYIDDLLLLEYDFNAAILPVENYQLFFETWGQRDIDNITVSRLSGPLAPLRSLTMYTSGQGTVSPGNGSYNDGSIVNLAAIPAPGWRFAGWSGNASGSSNITINMHSFDFVVTATFSPLPTSGPLLMEWMLNYAPGINNVARSALLTSDGGYLILGSSSGTVTAPYWLIKTNEYGELLWSKNFTSPISLQSMIRTADGNFALVGRYNTAILLLKIDQLGNVLSNRTYYAGVNPNPSKIIETSDNGFAILGTSYFLGNQSLLLIRIDSSGNQLWNKTYLTNANCSAQFVIESVVGFAFGGIKMYVTGNTYNSSGLVIQTNNIGNVTWAKEYGNSQTSNSLQSIVVSENNSYVLSGINANDQVQLGAWLLKIDFFGNVIWSRTYFDGIHNGNVHGFGWSNLVDIVGMAQGGYAFGGGLNDNHTMLMGTDLNGNFQWSEIFSTSGVGYLLSIEEISEGGYIVAGTTNGGGPADAIVIKYAQTVNGNSNIIISNVVEGSVPDSPWLYLIIDNSSGAVIGNFTLPAAGGSTTIPVSTALGGNFIVSGIGKYGYAQNMEVNSTSIDDYQAMVHVDAGNTINVTFINNAPGFQTQSLDNVVPSQLPVTITQNKPMPFQVVQCFDKNGDGKLDLVVNKTMAILVDLNDATIAPTDSVTLSVTFDERTCTNNTLTGVILSQCVISFYPIVPNHLGDFTITGTYKVGTQTPKSLQPITVTVKDTLVLPLYYAYFTKTNYASVSQAAYNQMTSVSTNFINQTYPVKSIITNMNYQSISGNATAANYLGAKKDCINIAAKAKANFGGNTNAMGIAIEPANYFTYHKFPAGVVGVSFGPGTKGVIIKDGWPTTAAHEVAHASYGVFYPKEYYSTPSLKGTTVCGVDANLGQWKTGWDIMDLAGTCDNTWMSTKTFNYLLCNTTKTLADPEILIVNGIIYKNGSFEQVNDWYHVSQGIPDVISSGNYSLQFLAANGTIINTTSFDASFSVTIDPGFPVGTNVGDISEFGTFETDSAPFCFAVEYPKDTAKIEVINSTKPGQDDLIVAIPASEIVTLPNTTTFTESGLPTGTSWSVTLEGKTQSSTTNKIAFTGLAAGTYSWNASTSIQGASGIRYGPTTSSGTINVQGDASQSITYVTLYQVSFASNNAQAGTTNPSTNGYYMPGSQISIAGTSNQHYTFWTWNSSTPLITFASANSASTTATINGPGTITATFGKLAEGSTITVTGTNNVIIITGGDHLVNCKQATSTTIIKTGKGDNIIFLGPGNNVAKETANGNDAITATDDKSNNDIDITGNGNYAITTLSGNDRIKIAGNGACIIYAGNGDNVVTVSGTGNNAIVTGNGNDKITVGNGNNIISSNGGGDVITVGSGNNYINGGSGTDSCFYGSGRNVISNCEKKTKQ